MMRSILEKQVLRLLLFFSVATFLTACSGRLTNPATTPQITSASFVGVDKVWLTTFRKGKILRSFDAGLTWSDVSISNIRVDRVAFIDEKQGWAISGQGEIWKTVDSGGHWAVIGKIPQSSEFHYSGASQLSFRNETEGWMIDAFAVWCTEDGGRIWNRCFSSSTSERGSGWPASYFRIDAKTAWVGATDGELYRTTDGLQTWKRHNLSNDARFTGLYFVDQNLGWVAGSPKGGIYCTMDGGDTWVLQTSQTLGNIAVESLDFVSKQEGWAVGRVWPPDVTRSNTRSLALHTVDGGQRWEESSIGEAELFFTQVRFPNATNGWIVGRDSLYRTENGGKDWRKVLSLEPDK